MTNPKDEHAHKAEPQKADPHKLGVQDTAAATADRQRADNAKAAAAAKSGTQHFPGKSDEQRIAEARAVDTREADTAKVIADRKAAAAARGETTDDKGFVTGRAGAEDATGRDAEVNPLAPPQVAPITETQPHTGGFMISEARGHRARHQGVVASGAGIVLAGTVMGQITASKKFIVMSPAAVDGSQTAAGILYGDVDATSADKQAAFIVRDAEVNIAELVWGAGVTTQAHKDAALASLAINGLIGRPGL